MTEAIFGLVGVFVGGFLTWGLERLERRSERRARRREAARVLWGELLLLDSIVASIHESESWRDELPMDPLLSSWDIYRADLAALPWKEYDQLLRTFAAVKAWDLTDAGKGAKEYETLLGALKVARERLREHVQTVPSRWHSLLPQRMDERSRSNRWRTLLPQQGDERPAEGGSGRDA